jgi:hypothetical protein
MDLLATILTCSLYASDDALVRAIAEGPSRGNPYLVLDPVADSAAAAAPPLPKNVAEATARAQGLIAEGGRPLLGLLELLPAWVDLFGRPLASAFDPCTNIAIGSAMLSEFDHECAMSARGRAQAPPLERVNRRACVLRRYETATGADDFEEAILLELSVQQPASASIADTPIFAPKSARTWGPDRLLVPLPIALAPSSPRPAVLP